MTHEAHAAAVEALVATAGKLPGSPFLLSLAEGDALVRAYLAALAERGFKVVPREACHDSIKAAAESRANDDEGTFPPLCDLIDFSGQNALHSVIAEALRAAHDAAPPWPPAEK